MFLRAKECLTSTDSLIDTLLNISQSRTPFSPFMTSERLKRPSNWSFILSVQSLSKKLTFCLSQNENELEFKNSEWKAENPKLGYMISRFVVSPVPLGTAQNLRLHCVWTQTAGVLKKNKENWTELCSLSYIFQNISLYDRSSSLMGEEASSSRETGCQIYFNVLMQKKITHMSDCYNYFRS